MQKLLFALAFVGFSGNATADVVWDQTWDGVGGNAIAQVFRDFPTFDSWQYDDFSIGGAGFFLTTLTVEGLEDGDPSFNLDIIAEVWDGLPGIFGGNIVMTSVSGSEDPGTGTLTFDFGGQALLAGDYWITAYVVRSFGDGGQWFWYRTNTDAPIGSEHYFWNPGEGLELGPDPIPGSIPYGSPADMNFVLEGDAIPAPSALGLLGLAGLIGRRRRRR